jgi:hypothetical protein
MSVREMMTALGFGSRDKFLKNYLSPALKSGLIEMTAPNSPKSPKQRYKKSADHFIDANKMIPMPPRGQVK